MGYRSRVECRIVGDKEAILEVIAMMRLVEERQDLLTDVLNDCFLVNYPSSTPGQALFGWSYEDVKWYSDYDDVQLFTRLWDQFESREHEFSGGFARIGEDDDDAESKYFGNDPYDLVILRRAIDTVSLDGPNLLSSKIESPETTQGTT